MSRNKKRPPMHPDAQKQIWNRRLDRRELLKTIGMAGSILALTGPSQWARALAQEQAGVAAEADTSVASVPPSTGEVPRRALGKTGVEVSALCFGGAHWGRIKDEAEAIQLLHEAIDAGVTFLDNAWEYNGGRSEELMGRALMGRRPQAFLMTKVCSHGRDKKVALQQLEDSLRRLRTDYLDLWQIHEVVYPDDPERHFAPNGAVEALLEAKRQGKVRFIGFTGHKSPGHHLKMLTKPYAWDALQMPLNVLDPHFGSFERMVLPEAVKRNLGIVGMKPMAFQNAPKTGVITSTECLHYAMSLPVSVTITGCETFERLNTAIEAARTFRKLSDTEMQALRDRMKPFVKDGQSEPYKVTKNFDNTPAAFPPPYEA